MNNGASEPGLIGDNSQVWGQMTAKLSDPQAVVVRERAFLQTASDEEKLARFYDYQEVLERGMMEASTPEAVHKIEQTLERLQGMMMDLKIRVGVA